MRRLWRGAAVAAVSLVLATACSRSAASDPAEAADTGPRVYASGTISWGQSQAQTVEWNLQEIAGFSSALSLKAVAPDRVTTLSASRQSPDDQLWFVWATVADGAPTVVFGGAAGDVDQVVVVDTQGNQVPLKLTATGRNGETWRYAMEQLPPAWASAQRLDVVGLAGAREIAREPLARVA